MIQINKIKEPFIYYCQKVIPLAFDESLSYYEVLCHLTAKIKEVIDEQNIEGQAIQELQEKYLLLAEYVENYFDNLDIQEEINNKLDEMAESGELADIIAQYLELAGVLAYNTINELSEATNVNNGSICYCLGAETYDDGYGSFYKVRTITSQDVIDDYNIVALPDVTIIAERIESNLKDNIDNIEDEIYDNRNILLNDDYYLFIGDSYATGYTPDGDVTSWCDYLAQKLGIGNKYYKYASNGAGFVATGSGGKTFLQVLQENIDNITNKNAIKKIIVAGGYNDSNYNSSYSDMVTAINTFNTYTNTQFPNSQLYIACIGYNANKTGAGAEVRDKLIRTVIPAYRSTPNVNNPCVYINNSNLILHNSDLFSSDGFHPNENGQYTIANKLYSGLINGNVNLAYNSGVLGINMSNSGGHVNSTEGSQTLELELTISNNIARIWLQENVNLMFVPAISIVGNTNYEIGTYVTKYLAVTRNTSFELNCKCLLVSTTQGNNLRDCKIKFTTDGKVYFQIKQISGTAGWETISNITQISVYAFGDYTFLDFN